jgi:hypothetical protein
MKRMLQITNALLAVIAVCLVLLVASVYHASPVATAHAATVAQPPHPQPVYLVYWDDMNQKRVVVGADGKVPTR